MLKGHFYVREKVPDVFVHIRAAQVMACSHNEMWSKKIAQKSLSGIKFVQQKCTCIPDICYIFIFTENSHSPF